MSKPQINIKPDCGNSPKKLLLKNFNIAFVVNDKKSIIACVTEDIEWNVIGEQAIKGITEFKKNLEKMDDAMTILTVDNIITHGSEGASNGTMTMKDGNEYAFCDVYTFSNTKNGPKIKSITSYVMKIN